MAKTSALKLIDLSILQLRKPAAAKADAPRFLDLNILPAEYRPRLVLLRAFGLAVALVVALVPAVPLFLANSLGDSEISQLRSEAKELDARVAALGTSVREARAMRVETDKVASEDERLRKEHWDLIGSLPIWSSTIAFAFHVAPPSVRITSVALDERELNLKADTADSAAIFVFVRGLQQSVQFSRVRVASVGKTTGATGALFSFAVAAERRR